MSTGEHCHARCLLYHFTLSIDNRRLNIRMSLIRTASWIPDCNRSIICIGIIKHCLQLIPVLRSQYDHMRHMRQIRQIIDTLVRLSILSDKTGTVNRQNHMQLLQAHIM